MVRSLDEVIARRPARRRAKVKRRDRELASLFRVLGPTFQSEARLLTGSNRALASTWTRGRRIHVMPAEWLTWFRNLGPDGGLLLQETRVWDR